MVRNNEFTADSFAGAIRKATAAYDRSQLCEVKNQRRCNDLVLEISSLQREIGRMSDDADRLSDEAERLRQSAFIELGLSALAALSSLSGALRALRIIGRRLKRRNSKKLTEQEILDLLSLFGPLGAAIGALHAATQFREAEMLARKAEEIERNGEQFGRELLDTVREYARLECGQGGPLIS